MMTMTPPTSDEEVKPEKIEQVKEADPSHPCNLFDAEMVRKIAEEFIPGLASACVDNTTGGLFKSPATVAVEVRKEMVDYLTMRSETFVAESVVVEGNTDEEISDNPYDIISNFIDDFGSSKRNFFSRVSGWVLSERREDRIDDFVQEMEIEVFWLIQRRENVAQTLLKNVDFKNAFHCNMKFNSVEELSNHLENCSFRTIDCMNEGCNASFTSAHLDAHDSTCPFKIIACEQNCSDSIMRREMDRHCITACPMKLVNCPFYAAGCQATIPKCKVEQHCLENVNGHLLDILKVIYKEAPVECLKPRVEQVKKLSFPGKLENARGARSLTIMVKDIEAKLEPLEISIKKFREEQAQLSSYKEECLGSSNGEGCLKSPSLKVLDQITINKENQEPNTQKQLEECKESPSKKQSAESAEEKELIEETIVNEENKVSSPAKELEKYKDSPSTKEEFAESAEQKKLMEETIVNEENKVSSPAKELEKCKDSPSTKEKLAESAEEKKLMKETVVNEENKVSSPAKE